MSKRTNNWTIMAPHARLVFGAEDSDTAMLGAFRQELGKIAGVKIKKGLWNVPLNALHVVNNLQGRYPGVTTAAAHWVQEPARPADWERVEAILRKGGEVQEWVLDGFLTYYQKEAIAFGWSSAGIHFWHPTGCLTGDTKLKVNRAGKTFDITLKELVEKFNGSESGRWGHGYTWDSGIPTMVQCAIDGHVKLNRLEAAFYTGEKEVFGVCVTDPLGTKHNVLTISATKDHRFLTPDGFKRLEELSVGDRVIVRGAAGGKEKKPKADYKQVGARYHPHAVVVEQPRSDAWCDKRRHRRGYVERSYRVPEHRLVAEARLNGLSLESWVKVCRTPFEKRGEPDDVEALFSPKKYTFLDPKEWAVHHKDGDHRNNAKDNLEVLSHEAHWQQHGREELWQNVVASTTAAEITNIVPLGKDHTYDLTMESPHNNYVANGFVVHNSGKTLTGLLCALSVEGPVVVVTRAASRLQYAREIERFLNVRAYIVRPDSQTQGQIRVKGQSRSDWLALNRSTKEVRVKGESYREWQSRHKGQFTRDEMKAAWAANKEKHGVDGKRWTRKGLEAAWKAHQDLHGIDPPKRLKEYIKTVTHRPFVVVGWEALSGNLDLLTDLAPGSVIFDECFPAGTEVTTREGEKAIETVEVGDEVLSVNPETGRTEWKRVTRCMSYPQEERGLIEVEHEHGYLTCTPNHKVWTKEVGYVEAGKLSAGDHLCVLWEEGREEEAGEGQTSPQVLLSQVRRQSLGWNYLGYESREGLRVVPDEVRLSGKLAEAVLQSVMFSELEDESSRGKRSGCAGRQDDAGALCCAGESSTSARSSRSKPSSYAKEQPDEETRISGKGQQDLAGYGARSVRTRGERDRVDQVREAPSGQNRAPARVCGHTGVAEEGTGCSAEKLQDRPGRHEGDAGCRSRRDVSPSFASSGAGCEEGQHPGPSWLDSSTCDERGGSFESGCRSREALVYDLEVEDNHNYFASGVLVSNSHRGKSSKRWDVVHLPEFSDDPAKAEEELRKHHSDARVKDGFVKDTGEEGWKMWIPVLNTASAAARLARAAKKRLCTTATPVKDRVRDLWAQLDLAEPNAWGNATTWLTRYADRKPGIYGGFDTTGTSNLDELNARLGQVAHILAYEETHRQLPKKRRQSVYLAPEDQCSAAAGYPAELREAKKRGANAMLEVRLAQAASKKRKAVLDMVIDHVSSKHKVVIFTGRKRDCDQLGHDVRKSVSKLMQLAMLKSLGDVSVWSAHGEQSVKHRQGIIDAYMEHPGPCVLVGTGHAFGESLNIHDTDAAFFVMLPYTPGQLRQWEGRFTRLGQTRPVVIYYVIAEDTVDEHIASILIDKLPAVQKIAKDGELAEAKDVLAGFDPNQTDDEFVDSVLADLDFS